jgi:hypothetical protein
MITAILSAVGGIIGIILYTLNRKTPTQRNFEAIEQERRKRLRDIDAWWTKRPPADS